MMPISLDWGTLHVRLPFLRNAERVEVLCEIITEDASRDPREGLVLVERPQFWPSFLLPFHARTTG